MEILKEEENYFCSRGTNTTSIDFGFRPTVIIGDRVWLDADGDGMQSSASSEPGFANVVVQLVDRAANAIIGSTLTDELCVSLCVASFFLALRDVVVSSPLICVSQWRVPVQLARVSAHGAQHQLRSYRCAGAADVANRRNTAIRRLSIGKNKKK